MKSDYIVNKILRGRREAWLPSHQALWLQGVWQRETGSTGTPSGRIGEMAWELQTVTYYGSAITGGRIVTSPVSR